MHDRQEHLGTVRMKWRGKIANNQLDEANLKMLLLNAKGVAYRMMSSQARSFHIQEIAFARTYTCTAGRAYIESIIFADSKAGRWRRTRRNSLKAARRLGKASPSTDAEEMRSGGGRRQTTDKGNGSDSERKKSGAKGEKRESEGERQIALINLISFKQRQSQQVLHKWKVHGRLWRDCWHNLDKWQMTERGAL